jgi:hypothetical protein
MARNGPSEVFVINARSPQHEKRGLHQVMTRMDSMQHRRDREEEEAEKHAV